MTINIVYRVQCSGPCRRWLSLPDDYQPGEDLPLAALVPQPTAARAGMWPDETAARRAAFAAGWSSGTCPDCAVAAQDAPRREPHPTEADLRHALAVAAKFHGQETDAVEADVPVHAVPLPGSNGISACCGRPPCEFVGERVTRDPDAVTCPGPAASAGVQTDEEATR